MIDEQNYASQVLDPPAPTMETPTEIPEAPQEQPTEQPKRVSEEDAIKRAFDKADKAAKEEETKPKEGEEKDAKTKDEAKPDEKAKVKSDKVDSQDSEKAPEQAKEQPKGEQGAEESAKGTGQDGEDNRSSEGRKFHEPPARFLPKAKEVWSNVPNAVKAEISRLTQEHEAETRQYQEDRQFRSELKEYENLAKRVGTTVKQAMDRYVGIDKALNDPNPLKRAQTVLALMTEHGVDPLKFAEEIVKNRQHFQNAPRPDPTVHRAVNSTNNEVAQLKQELASFRQEIAAQKYETGLFAEFRRQYPSFDEHRQSIATVLNSGIIEKLHGSGLSDRDRLEIAYSMAVPNSVRAVESVKEPEFPAPELPDDQPQDNVAGRKSITGAPNGVNTERKRKKTPDEAIQSALDRYGL